jgi:hypothetical protein
MPLSGRFARPKPLSGWVARHASTRACVPKCGRSNHGFMLRPTGSVWLKQFSPVKLSAQGVPVTIFNRPRDVVAAFAEALNAKDVDAPGHCSVITPSSYTSRHSVRRREGFVAGTPGPRMGRCADEPSGSIRSMSSESPMMWRFCTATACANGSPVRPPGAYLTGGGCWSSLPAATPTGDGWPPRRT